MIVYKLKARFVCPLTGMDGRPQATRETRNVFSTLAGAVRRVETFKAEIRNRLMIEHDYPIDVEVLPVEVIED